MENGTQAMTDGMETTARPAGDDGGSLPLAGLVVIDLTIARAGPTAVRHLADWGADVIRIDQPLPPNGNPAKEDVIGSQNGSDYQNLHRNKRSMRLDLKHPDGKAVLMDLVRRADVVVENMRPDVKHRLGIAYDDLKSVNPRIVYGSISGFGQSGPYRDRAGVDQIAQGMGGLMSVTGRPGTGPMRVGIAIADLTAGNMLALNIMMALYQRVRTGEGRWVHTSLLESQVFMMDFQASRWLVNKEVAGQAGNEHPTGIPTGVYETLDGHVNLSASSTKMWDKLCEIMEQPEWLRKEQWRTQQGRLADRAAISAAVNSVTRTRPSKDWIEALNAGGIPCGPIYTMDEVFADEQTQELGMALPVEHPRLGSLQLVASPLNFEGVPRTVRRATPDAGSDTAAILRSLGYPENRIQALVAGAAA
jgi:crotonobetainyl-CoA:carnitine CoA-transferase CaiB-like acyl-CoA transferase